MFDIEKFFVEEDHGCAETLIMALSDTYDLGVDEEMMKLLSGFNGGMGCEKTCGALSGCIAALGKMMVEGRAHATEGFKEACTGFVSDFEERFGSADCADLKPKYHREDVRCLEVVEETYRLFLEKNSK